MDATIRHYALEAQAFVVSVTSVLAAGIIEALGKGGSTRKLKPGGGYSAIVESRGKYLAGPEENEGRVALRRPGL